MHGILTIGKLHMGSVQTDSILSVNFGFLPSSHKKERNPKHSKGTQRKIKGKTDEKGETSNTMKNFPT